MSNEPLCTGMTRQQSLDLYRGVLADNDAIAMRELCRRDLFFLLVVGCKRKDINRDWLYERCRQIEVERDGYLDLWAREHYKSTIITYGLSIQDILIDPSVTIGIFSHTRPIAKAFLKQIKVEFEENTYLKGLFKDILYENPGREAPQWSFEGGITVKRPTNPKEATVEAWGLVDGQPTSKHYSRLVYDDVVTRESVSTPDQIAKTNEAWGLSLSLGAAGGTRRYIGTRYHFNDTYRLIMEQKAATPRIYPATVDGTPEGVPVLMDKQTLAERRLSGPYIFACQYLQNPIADDAQGFREEWLRLYEGEIGQFNGPPRMMNIYLLVDPASAKKKDNDFTVAAVIGLSADRNMYLLDLVRDRLNLTERTDLVFELKRRWKPIRVGYEQYGMQADIEHIKYVQAERQERFEIYGLGGSTPKVDRIRKLVPWFEQGKMWLPRRLVKVRKDRTVYDATGEFLRDEYLAFPVSVHDDMLDCMARVIDPELRAVFPQNGVAPGGGKVKVVRKA